MTTYLLLAANPHYSRNSSNYIIEEKIRNDHEGDHLRDFFQDSLVNDHLPAVKQKIVRVNKWKN